MEKVVRYKRGPYTFCGCPETFGWCHPWPIAFSCCSTNPISSPKTARCRKRVPRCRTRVFHRTPHSLEFRTLRPQPTMSPFNQHYPLRIPILLDSTSRTLNLHPKFRNIQRANSYRSRNCWKVSSKMCGRFSGRTPTCKKGPKTSHLHKMREDDMLW